MARSVWRTVRWILATALVAGVVAFVAWAYTPAAAMSEALTAIEPGDDVDVSTGRWLVFTPTDSQPATGLILYPGGRVDHRAYAPAARAIAARGYLVAIVPMPFNLAFLGSGRASDVIASFPQVGDWVVGGHSLGGAFAAQYVARHAGEIDGLVLWAAYPAANNDLSGYGGMVASIHGTLDGLATHDEIRSSAPLLPEHTLWVAIEGGNHAQFGWYGDQSGDNQATISRAEQQSQIVSATTAVLAEVQGASD